MSAKKKNIISKASPHTIKKFELIEEYIKSWAQKLLLTESCNGLIFIDCMCNSGVYTDDAGRLVKGTAVRVSEALREASRTYTEKNIHIYLNDKDKARVDELKKHLPQDERNFKIVTSCGDAHELLRTIGPQLYGTGADFSELVIVLSGTATHVVDGEEYPIRKGDVFVISNNTAHG